MEKNNPVIISDYEQRSPEWLALRKGKITATKFAEARNNYGFRSPKDVAEEIKGHTEPQFTDDQKRRMAYGVEMEPVARDYYCSKTNSKVLEVGFAIWKKNLKIGCSVDGIVIDSAGEWLGLVEIKCPEYFPKKYPKNPETGDMTFIPSNYVDQIQGCLMIFDLPWCDFVVYSKDYQLIHRVYKDEEYCRRLHSDLEEFIEEFHL